jgi:hypothetical protein
MAEYRITTDTTELPRGSYFYTLPGQVAPGSLALFKTDDGRHIVGRWFENLILQPDRWIYCRDRQVRRTDRR